MATIHVHLWSDLPSWLREETLPPIKSSARGHDNNHAHEIQKYADDKRNEPVVVYFADAQVYESAVVIETSNASVASHAMLGFFDHISLTVLAVPNRSSLPLSGS